MAGLKDVKDAKKVKAWDYDAFMADLEEAEKAAMAAKEEQVSTWDDGSFGRCSDDEDTISEKLKKDESWRDTGCGYGSHAWMTFIKNREKAEKEVKLVVARDDGGLVRDADAAKAKLDEADEVPEWDEDGFTRRSDAAAAMLKKWKIMEARKVREKLRQAKKAERVKTDETIFPFSGSTP